MATHRKPVPRFKTPDVVNEQHHLSTHPHEEISQAVDRLLYNRHSLTQEHHSFTQEHHSFTQEDPFEDRGPPVDSQQEYIYIQPDYVQSHSQLPSRAGTVQSYRHSYGGLPSDEDPGLYALEPHNSDFLPTGPETAVDHFQHDVEAYASGNHSRASFRPPRSRSPTPAVDDEDYHIVGSESVHYTGYPPHSESEHTQVYDQEKQQFDEDGNFVGGYSYDQGIHFQVQGNEPADASPTHFESDLEETRHFGPAPTGRAIRRHKTTKRVQLTNGNLVVDVPVPPKLVLPRKGVPETMMTRYTAVTCDPDEFETSGFSLRQNENGRKTEVFIAITMYNVGPLLILMRIQTESLLTLCRKMRFCFVGQSTVSCGTLPIYARGKTLKPGVPMLGRR